MRRALVSLLAVAALALVGVAAGLGVLYASADTSTVGELEFANELRIPPLLEGQADGDGAKVFDLRLQTGTTELLPGTTTETWGVNGPYLGPTLRVSSGDRVQMNVRNELPEPTTVHWHGMHLPAGADGGPHQPIAPGGSWAPAWTVDQPAATLWYHPHPHPDSDEQIYRGVAGMIVVDDADGGLLEVPIRLERLPLSPGERAEIVVGLEPGERVVLRSFEPDLGTNVWDGRFAGADDSFDLLELRASASLRPSAPLPAQLGPPRRVGTPVPRADRSFELGGQGSIDDREFDPNRIDVEASAGSTELWEVRNASGTPHNFHVHGVRFQVVDYAGGSPPPRLVGWKDTVYVPPDETVRFLVELGDYADPEVPYMFHCHVLQHQDRGMMGQFVVTEEATR